MFTHVGAIVHVLARVYDLWAILRENVYVLRTSVRVICVCLRVLAPFGLFFVSLCMFCVQCCVSLRVFACFGARWALLRESVYALRTMLRVFACLRVCVGVLS